MTVQETTIEPIDLGENFRLPDRELAPRFFDYGLVQALIGWAVQDHAIISRWGHLFVGRWDQDVWGVARIEKVDEETIKDIASGSCGTAFCMAGQAVIQKGYRLDYGYIPALGNEFNAMADSCIKVEWTGAFDDKGRKVYEDQEERGAAIRDVAQYELGLTDSEANLFFSGSNDITMLKRFANGLAEVRGLPLMFPEEVAANPHNDTEELVYDDYDEVD